MAKLTPQRRAELNAEREFLVASLADLEVERSEGGVDPDTYATLHSDYTARAAAVLRALAGGNDDRPTAPKVATGRRAFAIGAVVVFIGLAAFALARSAGTRAPGDTLTGNSSRSFNAVMQRAAAFAGAGDINAALAEYQKAEQLEPDRAEVPVELAKLLIQQIQAGNPEPKLVEAAEAALDRAIALDPTYADAFAFKGVLVARIKDQPAAAQQYLDEYLRLAPNGQYAPMARSVLGSSTSTSSVPAPSTTAAPSPAP